MFTNRSEAPSRVLEAIYDIKACCEIGDYYEQWSDVVASSIQAFLEDLSAEQVDDICGAFREYISETVEENPNLADGIRDSLRICLSEMLDYIEYISDDDDSKDKYFDYNRETACAICALKIRLCAISYAKTEQAQS